MTQISPTAMHHQFFLFFQSVPYTCTSYTKSLTLSFLLPPYLNMAHTPHVEAALIIPGYFYSLIHKRVKSSFSIAWLRGDDGLSPISQWKAGDGFFPSAARQKLLCFITSPGIKVSVPEECFLRYIYASTLLDSNKWSHPVKKKKKNN